MLQSLRKAVASLIVGGLLVSFGADQVLGQEAVGGPYEPDTNTVLLMHFDGNLENASDFSDDGVAHGVVSYVNNDALGLGEALRIDNDSQSDSSFVTVADTATLDLTGNWTIEGWINVFTFGETADDWRWVPRLIIKPGEEVFWRPNYWVEMWGDQRFFSSGYHSESGCCWPQSNTPPETMQPGQWYHLSFVRDTTEQVIAQLVHNSDLELVAFSSYKYDPITEAPPLVNDNPVHIGFAGGASTDSFLDGFVDEIRVSNIVRDFGIPPILSDMTTLANQEVDAGSYAVEIDAFKLGAGEIDEVMLHYRLDGEGDFQDVAMAVDGDRTFSGSIPGQVLGTVVEYYVTATDDGDLRATFPSNVEATEAYPSFGVYEPETQTLHLNFEEGPDGPPADLSQYAHEVDLVGSVTFVEDGPEGDYAIDFDSADSSYIEIASPFLASEQMTVELWFNADSINQDVRLISKEGTASWFNQNFEVKFMDGNRVAAGSYLADGTGYVVNDLFVDDSLSTGEWYHLQYVQGDVAAYLKIEDAEGTVIGEVGVPTEGTAELAGGPFRIGHSGPETEQYFDGRVDDVQIFNFAKDVNFSVGVEDDELPFSLTLEQNYPNPFNPVTTIRYRLPVAESVTLSVYDVLGRNVAVLVNDQRQAAGVHDVHFDGANLPSGVYFYQIKTHESTRVRSMLLLK